MAELTEVFACRMDTVWIWAHGHIDKRAFKGQVLSGEHHRRLDGEYEKSAIIKAKVIHGWVLTIHGYDGGCGWDDSTWFQKNEPKIVEGVWRFEALGIDPLDGTSEKVARVVDGPYEATWLEIH